MLSEADLNRVRWASRRGMLELDLLLLPFCEQRLPKLGADDQAAYCALLECEDTELFAWLLGKQPPAPEHAASIRMILDASREAAH